MITRRNNIVYRISEIKDENICFCSAIGNIDALAGYTQAQIMKMTTGEWMDNLAGRVGGTYETATNTKALQNEFTNILNAIKDTTTPARSN